MNDASAWRVSDVVAFDLMRQAANAIVALLTAQNRERNDEASGHEEIVEVERRLRDIDGTDRAQVDVQLAEFARRLDELRI